jgi:hypothetical protein
MAQGVLPEAPETKALEPATEQVATE